MTTETSPLDVPASECNCSVCTSACTYRPGWFLPGEMEKAAALLGLSPQEFFDAYISVDWYSGGEVFLLAPATGYSEKGGMYSARPTGRCALFKDGKCSIHAAKPFECRAYLHDQSEKETRARHEAVAKAWNTPESRQQIEDLLGYAPYGEESDSFFSWLSW